MDTNDLLELIKDEERFLWLSTNIKENCDTRLGDIDTSKIFVGKRVEDGGYVVGYRNGDGSILDIGLVAFWWCFGIRPFTKDDLFILDKLKPLSSFEWIHSR